MDTYDDTQKEGFFSILLRRIDVFGNPLQWYIGNNNKYGSIIGGMRSFLIVIASISVFIYSAHLLFNNRKGSFVYYNLVNPESDSLTMSYYNDFEIFIIATTSSYKDTELDPDVFSITLEQTIKSTANSTTGVPSTPNPGSTIRVLNFEKCDIDYFTASLSFSAFINNTYCINTTKYTRRNDLYNRA